MAQIELSKTSTIPGFDPVLGSDESASYAGFSTVHWRALVRDGKAPQPIRLSERKLGWRLSTLNAWIAARSADQQKVG